MSNNSASYDIPVETRKDVVDVKGLSVVNRLVDWQIRLRTRCVTPGA